MAGLNIAVVSDLHAFDDPKPSPVPSHLYIGRPKSQNGRHPISGLLSLIKTEGLSADLLLCPGDLGDKAGERAIQYAWDSVHEISKALGASLLAGTAGNHDVDSRYKSNAYDPREFLQNLSPHFPLADKAKCDFYWANHYVIVDGSNYRLLIVNSSAYHGGNPKEIDHGRISDNSLDEIEQALLRSESKPINLMMCHHHPQEDVELESTDYEAMVGGRRLLHLLDSGRFGKWLVVHGHRHHPKLEYAQGTGDSPAILSAGSLCACIYSTLQTLARNEFHIIRIDELEVERFGLVGRVYSWDWAFGLGWAKSRPGSGLPYQCGFGFRSDGKSLALRVSQSVSGDLMEWGELVAAVPEVEFLVPRDMATLLRYLKQNHGVHVLDLDGMPRQIGRFK